MGEETAEWYEEKAAQCIRLARSCIDSAALRTLMKLAGEYLAMAAALRRKEDDEEAP